MYQKTREIICIADQMAKSGHSLRGITKAINGLGYKTDKGNSYSPNTVYQLLYSNNKRSILRKTKFRKFYFEQKSKPKVSEYITLGGNYNQFFSQLQSKLAEVLIENEEEVYNKIPRKFWVKFEQLVCEEAADMSLRAFWAILKAAKVELSITISPPE